MSVLTKSWLVVTSLQNEAFLAFLPLKETILLGQESMVCSKSSRDVSNLKQRVILNSHKNQLNIIIPRNKLKHIIKVPCCHNRAQLL